MKLDELLDLAAHVQIHGGTAAAMDLGQAVTDLLGEGDRCGFERPELAPAIAKPTMLRVPATWADWVSPDDARAMARMLLTYADEAEG